MSTEGTELVNVSDAANPLNSGLQSVLGNHTLPQLFPDSEYFIERISAGLEQVRNKRTMIDVTAAKEGFRDSAQLDTGLRVQKYIQLRI